MIRLFVAVALSFSAFSIAPTPATAGSSTTTTAPNGDKITTVTRRTGTTCTVFSSAGQVKCSRTMAETNHQKAIAKCSRVKC